jgi:hypothetical protein
MPANRCNQLWHNNRNSVRLEQRARERERILQQQQHKTKSAALALFRHLNFYFFSLTLFFVIVFFLLSLSLAMCPELITTQKIFVYADLKKHLSFIFRLSLSLSRLTIYTNFYFTLYFYLSIIRAMLLTGGVDGEP